MISFKMITSILGGIGLFLLGMELMTDGLKTLAGDSLRKALSKFAGGKISALLSGATVTAVIQSSGATTIATIGFVSAGLLTFPQAIGVIFGANLGTTSTGWLVSLLGLKFKIGALSFPLIAAGAMMKLLSRERIGSLGIIIAGFGLIFVGIDILQTGMDSVAKHFDPSKFAGDSIFSSILLILIGLIMTVIMQSSSAAVATTLTALNAGTISFEHAAMLVIGQNIGKTVTTVLAAIGTSVPAKRTAVAHILFNVITAIAAFAILPFFLLFIESVTGIFGVHDPTIRLAAFHTCFNILGVIMLLPFTSQFAELIRKILPQEGPYLTRNLDNKSLALPAIAIEVARNTAINIASVIFETVKSLLDCSQNGKKNNLHFNTVENALAETNSFLGNVHTAPEVSNVHQRHISVLHALEHLGILMDSCKEFEHVQMILEDGTLCSLASDLSIKIDPILTWLRGDINEDILPDMEKTSLAMTETRKEIRTKILEMTASGELDPDTALKKIETIRWMERVTYRIWRAVHYLSNNNK